MTMSEDDMPELKIVTVKVTRQIEATITEEVTLTIFRKEKYQTPEQLAKDYVSAAVDAGQPVKWENRTTVQKSYPSPVLTAVIVKENTND